MGVLGVLQPNELAKVGAREIEWKRERTNDNGLGDSDCDTHIDVHIIGGQGWLIVCMYIWMHGTEIRWAFLNTVLCGNKDLFSIFFSYSVLRTSRMRAELVCCVRIRRGQRYESSCCNRRWWGRHFRDAYSYSWIHLVICLCVRVSFAYDEFAYTEGWFDTTSGRRVCPHSIHNIRV